MKKLLVPGLTFPACGALAALTIALASSASTAATAQALAADQCKAMVCEADGGAYAKVPGENTESETPDDQPGGDGFSISVDGEQVAGDQPTATDDERKTDVALEAVDIQVKFDGLDQKPQLNVATINAKREPRRTYQAGETVEFVATSNYPGWITREEVLIFPRDAKQLGKIVPILVPVGPGGIATWTMPDDGPAEFDYVLRVYDAKGRFDETIPLSLARTDRTGLATHLEQLPAVAPGTGDDRTALRNIPVYGGAITVFGRNVPSGSQVTALGENVPVDKDNQFVIQRILPPGDHIVDVAVGDEGTGDGGLTFRREVNIPTNDWFYVGLADLTVGHRTGEEGIEAVREGEFDNTYTKGRLAFYLKGKIKGRYLLTASADTREDKVENLFRGLDAKDPRGFLTRVNPEEYYPVYGDDSTAFEDAPTRGKFYVRLERGESRVMWGNFKATVAGGRFLRNERALYGASAVYKSESKTSFGESKIEAEGYAANAETLPQRDVLRATGGSAYFLKYQDIVVGSETITIQIRDRVSGRVVSTRRLVAGSDYEIDHLQGVVLLKRPLNSSTISGGATQPGSIGDDEVYVVAQYEHTPTAGDLSGSSFGGRAQAWLGDNVRLGATGMKEETGEADQEMMSADIVVRKSETTFLEAEVAQTRGPGFGRSLSADGGLTIDDDPSAGVRGKQAMAYSVKGQVDLADILEGRLQGTFGGSFERMEEGFSSIDHDIDATQRIWTAFANLAITDRLTFKADYEDYADEDAIPEQKREGTADLEYQINEYWKVAFGARYVGIDNLRGEDWNNNPVTWNGSRTDLGARLTYSPDDDTSVYAFGQGTVARTGNLRRNDRIGVGGETRLTDRIGIGAEVSYGTSGWGGLASVTYDPVPDRSYYLGYRLDAEDDFDVSRLSRSNAENSGFVLGMRHRYNDELSAFAEGNADIFGRRRSLTNTYGVTYTPDTLWTWTAGLEAGRVRDHPLDGGGGAGQPDFDRFAPSFAVAYKDEDRFAANLKAEARFEDSKDNTRDQSSYYLAGGVAVKTSEDWRVLANIDAVLSESDQQSVRDGDYIEASLGAAYRPIDNDRFNALFKYVFLYDLPGPDQVSAVTGNELGPLQRSHVLSVDGTYDLNRYLSIGAKYGVRIGQIAERDDPNTPGDESTEFTDSIAHLGVVRADFHVVRNWDVLAEGRVLYSPTAGTADWGALAAIYRHFGDNMKVGVGYNFGVFSDDLTDLTLDDQGVFLNVIGKF